MQRARPWVLVFSIAAGAGAALAAPPRPAAAGDAGAPDSTAPAALLGVRPVPIADADLRTLVGAERAFTRLSEEKGIRTAFLANLARDAIVFRPGPVPAVDWFRDRPSPAGTLVWEPDFAALSAAADLGYTAGPWEFRQPGDTPGSGVHGHYVTVWRREAEGGWRVVVDGGVRHAAPVETTLELAPRGRSEGRSQVVDEEKRRALFLDADRALGRAASSQGWPKAFVAAAAADVRLYRQDVYPVVGREAAGAALAARAGRAAWTPAGGGAARDGDFGYTWGTAEFRPESAPRDSVESSAYLRIWRPRRDGRPEIVLDLASPMPTRRR